MVMQPLELAFLDAIGNKISGISGAANWDNKITHKFKQKINCAINILYNKVEELTRFLICIL